MCFECHCHNVLVSKYRNNVMQLKTTYPLLKITIKYKKLEHKTEICSIAFKNMNGGACLPRFYITIACTKFQNMSISMTLSDNYAIFIWKKSYILKSSRNIHNHHYIGCVKN